MKKNLSGTQLVWMAGAVVFPLFTFNFINRCDAANMAGDVFFSNMRIDNQYHVFLGHTLFTTPLVLESGLRCQHVQFYGAWWVLPITLLQAPTWKRGCISLSFKLGVGHVIIYIILLLLLWFITTFLLESYRLILPYVAVPELSCSSVSEGIIYGTQRNNHTHTYLFNFT